jgi:hypothetical protein
MGGVVLKDKKIQPYLLERKRQSEIKLFRRFLNVTVHNALIVYNSQNPTCDHLAFRLEPLYSRAKHEVYSPIK